MRFVGSKREPEDSMNKDVSKNFVVKNNRLKEIAKLKKNACANNKDL